MLFIKGTKVILLSKYAPRFLADGAGEITASPTDRVSVSGKVTRIYWGHNMGYLIINSQQDYSAS